MSVFPKPHADIIIGPYSPWPRRKGPNRVKAAIIAWGFGLIGYHPARS